MITSGVVQGNSYCNVQFSDEGSVSFTPNATPHTILNVVGSANVVANAGAVVSGKAYIAIYAYGTYKVGEKIQLWGATAFNGEHIASVTWTNGDNFGQLNWVVDADGVGCWEIPASVTATMDASQPLVINPVVETNNVTLKVENTTLDLVQVKYIAPGDADWTPVVLSAGDQLNSGSGVTMTTQGWVILTAETGKTINVAPRTGSIAGIVSGNGTQVVTIKPVTGALDLVIS